MRLPNGIRAALAASAAVTALTGCGSTERVALPYNDSFEGDECRWHPAGADPEENATFGCTNGAYRVAIKNGGDWQISQLRLDRNARGVKIAADIAVSHGSAAVGISCWQDDGQDGFSFLVDQTGDWAVRQEKLGGGAIQFEAGKGLKLKAGAPNRLEATCAALGEGVTALAFTVNGRTVVRTTSALSRSPIGLVGLYTFGGRGTEIAFDNVAVSSLDQAQLVAAETESLPVACGHYDAFKRALTTYADSYKLAIGRATNRPQMRAAARLFYADAATVADRLVRRSQGTALPGDASVRDKLVDELKATATHFETGERTAAQLPVKDRVDFAYAFHKLHSGTDEVLTTSKRTLESDVGDRLRTAFAEGSACEPVGELFGWKWIYDVTGVS